MLKTTSVLQSERVCQKGSEGIILGKIEGGVGTLRQCLNLGGFDADATEPDDALYHHRSNQGTDRHGG